MNPANTPETKRELPSHLPALAGRPAPKFPLSAFLSFLRNIFASTQSIIGIDIGSNVIKAAQLQKTAKGYLLINYIARTVPGSIRDNPPEKKRLVQELIKEFIADSRLKSGLGRLSIWGKGVFIFSLSVPSLNKKDLRGAVSMELKKRLPFQLNLDNIVFDFFVTGQLRDEKGLTLLQVTCIACDRAILEEQLQSLKEMCIRPVGINVTADCLGNLLPYCLKVSPEKTIALLDMGANSSTLNFYKAGALRFSREIPIGGDHLTHALARTIPSSAGPININLDEAEKIKRQCGIPLLKEAKIEYLTDFGTLSGEQISAMLRTTLERLIMEINRTFNYYASTFNAPRIEELYITGGSSRLKNLNKFFLDNLKELKKIESLNSLKAIKGWQDTGVFRQELVMEQAAPHLAAAFGIAIGSGGRVNLLPVKERLEQKAFFITTLLKISFPLILTLSFAYFSLTYINTFKYKKMLRDTQAQLRKLEPAVNQAREYLSTKSKLEQRKALLEQARGKQPFWWAILKELSNITPDEVVLRKLRAEQLKQPKEIRIEGKIYAKYTNLNLELSQYQITLEDSPYFSRVQQVACETDMYSPIPTADFELVCQLTY